MKARHTALALVPLALWSAGCGPAGITAAIVSGDDGGGGSQVENTTVDALQAAEQPDDDKTTLVWRFGKNTGRMARVRFEYRIAGDGRVRRIAPELVEPKTPRAQLDAARGQWLFATGTTHTVVWNHTAQMRADHPSVAAGQREFRDVRVDIRFADQDVSDAALLGSESEVLWPTATIGRQPAQIVDLRLGRAAPDDGESNLILVATLSDFGADAELWQQQLEVARTAVSGARFDRPTRVGGVPALHEPVRYRIVAQVDPLRDAALLPGAYRGSRSLSVRMTNRETFGASSRFPTRATRDDLLNRRTGSFPVDVGRTPSISDVELPDPDPDNPLAEPRPRFLLPIKFIVANPSTVPVTVELEGSYRINNGARVFSMTLHNIDRPGTAARLDLPAGSLTAPSRTVHYLLWNVARDEGVGIPLHSDDPDLRRVAQVRLRASIVDAARAGVGEPLGSPWFGDPAWRSHLLTLPFVDFREELLPPLSPGSVYDKFVSNVDSMSARTRDIFYTYQPANALSQRVGVDQSFAPIALPDLTEFDAGEVRTGGFNFVVPTDVADEFPDCIASTQGGDFHLTFRTDRVERDPRRLRLVGEDSERRRASPFAIEFGDHRGAVILRHRDRLSDEGNVRRVYVNVALRHRDAGSPWGDDGAIPNHAYESAALPVDLHATRFKRTHWMFPGEFDGNPSTTDVLVGASGTEGSRIDRYHGPRSFLDVLPFRVRPAGTAAPVEFLDAIPLAPPAPTPPNAPLVPPLLGDPERPLEEWILRPLPAPGRAPLVEGGAPRADLMLVRELGAHGVLPREIAIWTLAQNPALRPGDRHLFEGRQWRLLIRLAEHDDLPGDFRLADARAIDLDGADGKAEVVLALNFVEQRRVVRQRLFVLTGGTRSGAGAVLCREVLSIDAEAGAQIQEQQFLDVNGDEFVDYLLKSGGKWFAYPSAFTGVAGALGEVRETVHSAASGRPAVVDLDRDGVLDVISGGRLHYGSPDRNYFSPNAQIFGSPRSPIVNVAEQILAPFADRADQIDVLTYFRDGAKINVVADIDDRQQVRLERLIDVRVRGLPIDAMVPFLPSTGADDPARGVPRLADHAKAVAALLRDAGQLRLYRVRSVGGPSFELDPTPWIDDAIGSGLLAAVRVRALSDRPDPARNTTPQQIVVATGRTLLFPVWNRRTRSALTVGEPGSAEEIIALANGSVSGDEFEDVVVLTREGDVLRVHAVIQHPASGFADPRRVAMRKLIQHEAGAAATQGFGFAFNPFAQRFGHGVLLLRDQIRFVLPEGDRASLHARMIRSNITDQDLEFTLRHNAPLVLSDFDFDGLVEVLGATTDADRSRATLFQVDRGYRR